MEWNFLIIVGFILRVIYHLLNEKYPFSSKTAEGWVNIKTTISSALFIGLFYFLSFYYHADDKYQDGWQLVTVWGTYLAIGWAIDSVWQAFINFFTQKILSRFSKKEGQ